MATDHRQLTFPAVGDKRPSTPVLKKIMGAAAEVGDPDLARSIAASHEWRIDYVDLLAELTLTAAASHHTAIEMARAGLDAMHDTLVLADDPERPNALNESVLNHTTLHPTRALDSEKFTGTAAPKTQLSIPYRGRHLQGAELSDQLATWVRRGVIEASCAQAVLKVADQPEWLALPGRRIAIIGAGSQMGPLEPLLSWGVDVLAIDLPRKPIWDRVRAMAEAGAGTVTAAVDTDGTLGIDLRSHCNDALGWLEDAGNGSDLTIGMYAYADSAAHVQVTAAADLLIQRMITQRPDTSLSWLATPTDAFLVPQEVVTAGQRAWRERGPVRQLQKPVSLLSRGKFFAPAYARVASDGRGVADILLPQQGPNYAVAKRLQRWRGVLAEAEGHRVSFNVAPATWTHSVTKNRILAAAYAGAGAFGVEIFEADTARALMAALLVHDLCAEPPVREHAEDLFSDQAAHGGLWRVGYEPRTALPFAAVGGLPLLGKRALRRS